MHSGCRHLNTTEELANCVLLLLLAVAAAAGMLQVVGSERTEEGTMWIHEIFTERDRADTRRSRVKLWKY